ncbi:MAG TPA: DUF1028 domain-containing protein [Thermoanaerobaculia bacterium]|nr:DUF1028 domain-containing protein [Thermoanaerobaculia bacterium]
MPKAFRNRLLTLCLLFLSASPWVEAGSVSPPPTVATFSIVAIDPANGDLGVAVASRYFSVGSVVPWAMAGVGAVATQANVNVGYGQQAIDLLRQGLTAQQVLARLLAEDPFPGKEGRQVAIVDAKGNVAVYTGPSATPWAGDRKGATWSAQGNILVGPQVPEAMGRAFESTRGELAEKLYAALKAGDDAGGDARGRQSASLLVVRKQGGRNINNDRYVYVNVDDHPQPLMELRRLLDLNLAYLYAGAADRAQEKGDPKGALEAARTAARYAPGNAYVRRTLGFLEYLSGDKEAALRELRAAQAAEPDFKKQLEDILARSPELKALKEDKAFLDRLFP